MSVRGCVVPLLSMLVWACGDDAASPQPTAVLEGRYLLAWSAESAAPNVTVVPGVAITIDQPLVADWTQCAGNVVERFEGHAEAFA